MSILVYKIIPEVNKNLVTFSKNYRIFSAVDPLPGAIKITNFRDDVDLGSGSAQYLTRKFRYSSDKGNWSLWFDLDPNNLSEIESLNFEDANVFFEVKYEYDDSSYLELASPIIVNSIKFNVESSKVTENLFTPTIYCSSEKCPAVIANQEATFKPYEVSTAIGIAKEMSYQTNKIFGLDTIYFKTEPDREGGDFIFKEWTLYKTISRKCAKVLVPDNKFPDNKPSFAEFGVDFEVPFEIHIDHQYFQSVFGPGSQPRKRDYLYFPLSNRMYEIQGSYLYRGFMMEPIYWKIQLTKFHPNSDMLMKEDDRKFLDNIIMTSEQLFGKQAEIQTKDALQKEQYSTISTRFDETRQSLHPEINNKVLDITYNYSPLIEYYYDMSQVVGSTESYTVSSDGSETDQLLTPSQPYEIYAYQGSGIYTAWRNQKLNTGDSILQGGILTPIKMNGPKESHTAQGKYVAVQGFRNLSLNQNERRSLQESTSGKFTFSQSEHAVIYKALASTSASPNLTYFSLIKFNPGSQNQVIFTGYDNLLGQGLKITCSILDNSGSPTLTIYVLINGTQYTFSIGSIIYSKWYAILVPVSAEFGQLEVNMYSFMQDPSNTKNWNGVSKVFSNSLKIGKFTFVTEQPWAIPGGNYSITNIRLFNTMIQDEDHEFVISQLFVRDESMLDLIDNARPRLNSPFIAINR